MPNSYLSRLREYPSLVFPEIRELKLKNQWHQVFADRINSPISKLVFEVGCSNAHYLAEIASKEPRIGFVGIDCKTKVLYKGAENLQKKQIKNVILIHGLAQEIESIFGEAEVDEVWIFFPDPWARNAQLKHRLIQAKFLLSVAKVLKPQGRLIFKTDHPGYFAWTLNLFGVQQEAIMPNQKMRFANTTIGRSWRQHEARLLNFHRTSIESLDKQIYIVRKISNNYYSKTEKIDSDETFSLAKTWFEKNFAKENLPIFFLDAYKKDKDR